MVATGNMLLCNWGEDDSKTKMTNVGNGLYEFTFMIKDFYGLADDEVAQQLAFVFRDENGSKVGKTKNNQDIFIPVNGYIPPPPKEKAYSYESRKIVSYLLHNDTIDILTFKRNITYYTLHIKYC